MADPQPATGPPALRGPRAATSHPESPLVSVDVVPLAVERSGRVGVVLSRRQFAPHKGRFALPGVLVHAGERLGQAATRALRTKSGLAGPGIRFLELTRPYDNPARDERGPTISLAYLAVVDTGAAGTAGNRLVAVSGHDPSGLPFDHATIYADGLTWAGEHLWTDAGRLARALLGPRFTGVEASALLADLEPGFASSNTSRLLRSRPCLRRADAAVGTGTSATTHTGARGRPPNTWEFVTPGPGGGGT